ncbi:MAG: HNH endonuclease [Thermoplasmata archaeon]|nr:HNH endonuclease [Thermoplasmata archaeon]
MARDGHPRPTRRQLTNNSAAWRGEARLRRDRARAEGRCVECHSELPPRHRIYCSNVCEWRFRGRYFWDAARVVVLRRDGYRCCSCGQRVRRGAYEIDHIRELARGGAPLERENLQTLCRPCHRTKTKQFLREFPRSSVRQPRGPEGFLEFEGDGPEWFPA